MGVERRQLIRRKGKVSAVEIALWRVFHATDRIDVGIAVPKIRLNADGYPSAGSFAVVPLGQELERIAAVP